VSSERKIQSARANGAKSRGPKTFEGRAKSARNAIKHGLTSETIVLQTESAGQFDSLRQSYIDRLAPADQVEADLVDQIVAARWRLERVWEMETALLDLEMVRQRPRIEAEFIDLDQPTRKALAFKELVEDSRALALLNRYEIGFQRTINRALETLRRLRETEKQNLPNEPNPISEHPEAPPPQPTTHAPQPTTGNYNRERSMIRIDPEPWAAMLDHARAAYPVECCGAMLGIKEDGAKRVTQAVPLQNVFDGPRESRYEVRPEDLLAATQDARSRGLELIGIYHSHPDSAACFSETDLRNSCPWYSFLVLSIRNGRFDHAECWLPDAAQAMAHREELVIPA
jgi:proteasome lid subunit RPN8/RPN11